MKKILSLALVLVFALSCLVACGGSNEYTLSIAVDNGFATVSGYKVTNLALALVTDSNGKIVAARFDSFEASVDEDEGEIPTSDRLTTKVELGELYPDMGAGHWFEQAAAFENYIKGMTAEEVAALDTSADKVGGDDPLIAGCTMISTTPAFQTLVAKAFAYERKVTFTTSEPITLGLAVDAKLTGDIEAGATLSADYAAVAIAGDKVVASMIDSASANYTFEYDEELEDYAVTASYAGTKNEQGDAYDINDYVDPMPSGRWYQQAQRFADTAVGKTVKELSDLSTDKVTGSCTISTEGYKATIVRAAGYAR